MLPKSKLRRTRTKKRLHSFSLTLGIIALVALVALIFLGKTINTITSFTRPYSPDNTAVFLRNYSWDGKDIINLAVKADKIYVLSLNPIDKTLTVLLVPDEAYVNVPLGFGSWSLGSVYELGQSEDPPIGAALVKGTLTETLGIPIDGYLVVENNLAEKPFAETVEKLRGNPLDSLSLLRQSKTDLSLQEYLKLIWGIRGIRFDKVETFDLGQLTITSWTLLADGSRVLSIGQLKMDQFIQKQIGESRLRDEGLSIGIYNTTQHPGLAEKAGRMISNLGGRVVFIANSQNHLQTTLVLGKPAYTSNYLSKIFSPGCSQQPGWLPWNQGHSSCQGQDLDHSQADINIFLGEDYFLRYNTK